MPDVAPSAPFVPAIVPPLQVVVVRLQTPLTPVTVRPPEDPVLLRKMAFAGVPPAAVELMLSNVSPLAPIVVLCTLSSVPAAVVVIVFALVPVVTVTVPPPVA